MVDHGGGALAGRQQGSIAAARATAQPVGVPWRGSSLSGHTGAPSAPIREATMTGEGTR